MTEKTKCTMRNVFIICLVICVSCKNKKPQIIKVSKIDSIRSSLVGKWGGRDGRKPVWKITQDSIYYYSQDKSYPYTILENDFVIDMGESKFRMKDISVKDDTLFFYLSVSMRNDIYGFTKAFRCK